MGASIALLCVPSLSDEFQDGADEEKKLMNRNMQDYKFSVCLCGKSLFGEGVLIAYCGVRENFEVSH
jgi:hypothetical protein